MASLFVLLALLPSPQPLAKARKEGAGSSVCTALHLVQHLGGKGICLWNMMVLWSCEGCCVGIWPRGTSWAGSAGCVYVRMDISRLVTLGSERGQKGGGPEEVRFMLASVALVRGIAPDICNLCPLPGLSS